MLWSDIECSRSPSTTSLDLRPDAYVPDIYIPPAAFSTPRLSKPLESSTNTNVPKSPPAFKREYELIVRQEPKQARMCGIGGKADRRPIDPPPIVQLRVNNIALSNQTRKGKETQTLPADSEAGRPHSEAAGEQDRRRFEYDSEGRRTKQPPQPGSSSSAVDSYPNFFGGPAPYAADGQPVYHDGNPSAESQTETSSAAGDEESEMDSYTQSFLQNPYFFMFASLAKPDDDTEMHWLKDGRTRCTTGSVVSSLYHLKDAENDNEDAGFFVFPDLSVRTEGSYRLKLSLFEVVGNNVRHCNSIYSSSFYVYTAKKFPGMEESTALSCSLADQGIKIRIRKDIRVRKRHAPPGAGDEEGRMPSNTAKKGDDEDERPKKRSRTDNGDPSVPAPATSRPPVNNVLPAGASPLPMGPPGVPLSLPAGGTIPPPGAPNPLGAAGAWPTSIEPNLPSPTITPPAPKEGGSLTPPDAMRPVERSPLPPSRPLPPPDPRGYGGYEHRPQYGDRQLPPPPPPLPQHPGYAHHPYAQYAPPPAHTARPPPGYPHYSPAPPPAGGYPGWGTQPTPYDPYAGYESHHGRYYPPPHDAYAYHDPRAPGTGYPPPPPHHAPHPEAYGEYAYRPRSYPGYPPPGLYGHHPAPGRLPPGHQLPVPTRGGPPLPPPAYSAYANSYAPPPPPPAGPSSSAAATGTSPHPHPPVWGTPAAWPEEASYRGGGEERTHDHRIQLAPLNLRSGSPDSADGGYQGVHISRRDNKEEAQEGGESREKSGSSSSKKNPLSIGSMVSH